MIVAAKKYQETHNEQDLKNALASAALAIEHLGKLVTEPLGGNASKYNKRAEMVTISFRLKNNIDAFQKDWSGKPPQININTTQSIMADGFSLLGMAMGKKGLGLLFSSTGEAISLIALESINRDPIPLDDFNAENIEGFIIELLQPLSDAIYDLFDKIDIGISTLLNNQDDSWVNLIIDKFDSKRLMELESNLLLQNAIFEQLHDWYYYKVTNNNYNGERFFADNPDVLQYTTAMGTGFASASQSNKYIDSFLMDLSSQISKNGDEPLLWTG
ncbi:MAG: hypothetical protein IKH45_05460, partial [Neisseriaceae bacterium]|nr:hypothetical protein [Neisseriaceae bacterium]